MKTPFFFFERFIEKREKRVPNCDTLTPTLVSRYTDLVISLVFILYSFNAHDFLLIFGNYSTVHALAWHTNFLTYICTVCASRNTINKLLECAI